MYSIIITSSDRCSDWVRARPPAPQVSILYFQCSVVSPDFLLLLFAAGIFRLIFHLTFFRFSYSEYHINLIYTTEKICTSQSPQYILQ